jgi:hypothetical protein
MPQKEMSAKEVVTYYNIYSYDDIKIKLDHSGFVPDKEMRKY